ncbi:MAG: glycosyltransferase N-terminal domain-containing protein [Paracoccaceae bacterium]
MKRRRPPALRNWGHELTRPFGLALYGLARRAEAGAVDWPARPAGPLVWLNAPAGDAAGSMAELARRLVEEDGVCVLVTCPDPLPARRGVIAIAPPVDTPAGAQAFLSHWHPEAGVFAEGLLRPALLHAAQVAKLPLILADARAPQLLHGGDTWFPGLMRGALSAFRQILAVDDRAAHALRKAGAPADLVFVTGRMEEESAVLPCLEAERAALARQIAARPVWLAAAVPEAEEDAVIAAHREALRLAHRLLLILVPQTADRATPLSRRMEEAEGWIVAQRAAEEEPTPETEVYIPDGQSEMGLWYRLAPITFMGGSLSGEGCLRNPLEPAALGSAITYGPRPGPWRAAFGRLGAARAARAVGSPRDLSDSLGDLMAPDVAARLAQAAWAVASEGAEVTDRVLSILRRTLEGDW